MRIRVLERPDCQAFAIAFTGIGWVKPAEQFVLYLEEQTAGSRVVPVAEVDGAPAGYLTIVWRSWDPVLRELGIPEITDLNVLPAFRRRGIGTALLDHAEALVAQRSDRVGLRMGLHAGFGAAQRLYVGRGFVPDGEGALDGSHPVPEGAEISLGDDICLRMTKVL